MKTKSQLWRYVLITILILLSILGVYIANRTYQYEIIVKGLLGFAVLYLLFFYVRFSGIDASVDKILADPKIYKYLIYALIGSSLAYWAMGGFFDMISFIIKTLINS